MLLDLDVPLKLEYKDPQTSENLSFARNAVSMRRKTLKTADKTPSMPIRKKTSLMILTDDGKSIS